MNEIKELIQKKKAELEDLKKKVNLLEEDVRTLERTLTILSSYEVKNIASTSFIGKFDNFKAFFEELCVKQNTSVNAMCDTIGFSYTAYYRWNTSYHKPTRKIMSRISNAINEFTGIPSEEIYDLMKRSYGVDNDET